MADLQDLRAASLDEEESRKANSLRSTSIGILEVGRRRSTATVRTTRVPWCLRGPAWLLPPTNSAPARPLDPQTGSQGHRIRARVGSATGCRRPAAHRPSAARQIRPGPRPLSPNSLPYTHLTLAYLMKLVEGAFSRKPS